MISKLQKIIVFASLCLGSICSALAEDYQSALKGKYLILEDASCAGLKFNAQATAAAWQNEMECSLGYDNKDAWRITWISPDIFMMTEVIRPNEISPPRNDVYKIIKIQNKTVTVSNYWTGWGTHKPEIQKFNIK